MAGTKHCKAQERQRDKTSKITTREREHVRRAPARAAERRDRENEHPLGLVVRFKVMDYLQHNTGYDLEYSVCTVLIRRESQYAFGSLTTIAYM